MTKISAEDMLSLHLAIETVRRAAAEKRLAALVHIRATEAVERAEVAEKAAGAEHDKARRVEEAAWARVTTRYNLTDADEIDLTTGEIKRAPERPEGER